MVHFLGSMVAAIIIFNFVARKLPIKKHQRVKETVIDERKTIMIFLVIASVAMLGIVVELCEFAGYSLLGMGEGMFFVGAGDSDNLGSQEDIYHDTMTDIIVNTIGSIIGVLLFTTMSDIRECLG